VTLTDWVTELSEERARRATGLAFFLMAEPFQIEKAIEVTGFRKGFRPTCCLVSWDSVA
jgi:hypothetical protein